MPLTYSSPHERILASAGSGKTWALASRYLRLVNSGYEPQTILASTFTRLAASEIRDRILARLADAADDPAERDALARSIGVPKLSRSEIITLLAGLARRVQHMNIRTLDSYFASIVLSFPLELDIPPGCRIVDEDEGGALRREAIRRMLDKHDPEDLVETLRLLTRRDPERSVMRSIDTVVTDLYSIWLDTDPDAWDCLPKVPEPDYALGVHLAEALTSVDVGDNEKRRDSHAEACRLALAWNWREFLDTKIVTAIQKRQKTWQKLPITGEMYEAYEPAIDYANHAVIHLYRQWNLSTQALLRRFQNQYVALKRERGVMTFQDLTSALNQADELTRERICYRLDYQLEHVLLDEFQDTSITQWRALKPMLHELASDLSTGRSVFCVGDLKQSIYEWRGASPEILDNLAELLFGDGAGEEQFPSRTLDTCWRCAPPVIEVVNEVFEPIGRSAALDKYSKVAKAWGDNFDTHLVSPPKENAPGYVELRTIDVESTAKSEIRQQHRIEETLRRVREIYHKAPAGTTIGVLTRTNGMANELLTSMQKEHLPASGPGGGPLTDVAAVNVVLDLFQLAEYPGDSAAAFHVARSPLGSVIEFEAWDHAGSRRAFSREIRRRIYECGVGSFIAMLLPLLATSCEDRELRRLVRLVEIGESFDAAGLRDFTALIRIASERNVADERPMPIQVLTVHKAKGLEYDAVILPELGSALAGTADKFAYERDGVAGRITRITREIKSSVRDRLKEMDCDVETLFDAMKQKHVRESLCMLYVAMTRAKQALYMIIDPPKINKNGEVSATSLHTQAGVVWSALSDGEPPTQDEIVRSIGDETWWVDAAEPKASEAIDDTPVHGPIKLAPSQGERHKAFLTASPSRAAHGGTLWQELQPLNRDNTERGTALHALFEQIMWMEDFTTDDRTLEAIVKSHLPRRESKWIRERLREFRSAIEQDVVIELLSEGRPNVQVWRERPFTRLTDLGMQHGIIDRLEVEFDESRRAQAARIIDYKTDGVSGPTVAAVASQYRQQLRAYSEAVSEMYNIANIQIERVLLFVPTGLFWCDTVA